MAQAYTGPPGHRARRAGGPSPASQRARARSFSGTKAVHATSQSCLGEGHWSVMSPCEPGESRLPQGWEAVSPHCPLLPSKRLVRMSFTNLLRVRYGNAQRAWC